MSLLHKILARSYKIFLVKNSIKKFFELGECSSLRVLLYHDIAPDQVENFKMQLDFLMERWKFITPDEFSKIMRNEIPVTGRNLLLSFDDGFLSNREVAEKILGPRKIKALFFIISNLIGVLNREVEKKLIEDNIFQGVQGFKVPDYMKGMNEEDIKYLITNGHEIGSHTCSHARLSQLKDFDDLKNEIYKSKIDLETKFKIPIRHFAYTFADFNSLSKEALKVAQSCYEFIYTGFRGNNIKKESWSICRDSIKTEDSLNLLGSFLEGGIDFHYKKRISIYEGWNNE